MRGQGFGIEKTVMTPGGVKRKLDYAMRARTAARTVEENQESEMLMMIDIGFRVRESEVGPTRRVVGR